MNPARVSITTLGCKVNAFESAVLAEQLGAGGWSRVAARQAADVCVINTCTVTREADRQARQEIRRAVKRNPGALIVVTGCYAQMSPAACAAIPGVHLVLGNHRKADIPRLLDEHPAAGGTVRVDVPDPSRARPWNHIPVSAFDGRARAYVQVQQGCDQGCTFCIIHQARGPSHSLAPRRVKDQIQRLVGNGHREIVLSGVDLGSYGEDLAGTGQTAFGLTDLLDDLLTLGGDFRVRLSSIDPVHVDAALIDCLATNPVLCPHLHLSLQSANTLILKRMKRRCTRERLYDTVGALRRRVPDLVLSADLLVGFPTETDSQFEDTVRAVEELEIAFAHVFPYSERPGTPAARIPRQVPVAERRRRARRVRETAEAVRHQVCRRWIGRMTRLVMEGGNGEPAGFVRGRLPNYLPARVADGTESGSTWLEAIITGCAGVTLIAEPTART